MMRIVENDSNLASIPGHCTQPPMGTKAVIYSLFALYTLNKNLAKAVRTTVNEVSLIAS